MARVVGVVDQPVQLTGGPRRHVPDQRGPHGLEYVSRGIGPLHQLFHVVSVGQPLVDGPPVLGPADRA